MTNRRAAVLQGIAEELDAGAVVEAAKAKRLDGEDRAQIPLRLPRWLADELRTYADRAGLSRNELIVYALWVLLHGDITPRPSWPARL